MMRTRTHTTKITMTPATPVISSTIQLTRSVPRGARASGGPARSPDTSAGACCRARWCSSLCAHPSAKPSATGSGRPTSVTCFTPPAFSCVPVSVVSPRLRAPRDMHASVLASRDDFLTIWNRGLRSSRALRRRRALNETRHLHEQERVPDCRWRVPKCGSLSRVFSRNGFCRHECLAAGFGCLRHRERRLSHAHRAP